MSSSSHTQQQATSTWSPTANQSKTAQHGQRDELASSAALNAFQVRPFVTATAQSTAPLPDVQVKSEESKASRLPDLTQINLFAGAAPSAPLPPAATVQCKQEADEAEQEEAEDSIQRKYADYAAADGEEEDSHQPVQTKLTIGQPGDRYEQEADRMAAKVVSMPEPVVQRQKVTTADTDFLSTNGNVASLPPLQAKGRSGTTSAGFEQRLQGTKGSGAAMDETARSFMEPRFGADFGQVRVHTDSTAVQMNKEVGAQAFAHGNDVYFNAGKYSPDSTAGKELLAHELTHTIQQTGGKLHQKRNKEDLKPFGKSDAIEGIEAKHLQSEQQPLNEQVSNPDNGEIDTSNPSKALRGLPSKNKITVDTKDPRSKELLPQKANPDVAPKSNISTINEQQPASQLAGNSSSNVSINAAAPTTSGSSSVTPGAGEGAGSPSAPKISVALSSEDPGQIIDQLRNTPPTQLAATYAQAGQASAQALENQRNSSEALIPEIPAPTGLPAQGSPNRAAPKNVVSKTPNASQIAAPKASRGEGVMSAKDQVQILEALPAPAPRPTLLAGSDAQPTEGKNDEALSRSAQNSLSQVSTGTDGVSTQVGTPPTVDLSGNADPAQVEAAQAQSAQEVQAAKRQAQQNVHQDFRENNIFPKASNETLKANKELTKLEPVALTGAEGISLTGNAVGGLNQSLSPYLQDKIGVEKEKYQTGKTKFDTDSQQARLTADQEMAQAAEATRQLQLQEQQAAQADVTQQRQEWQSEIDKADQSYQQKAAKAGTNQKQKIDTERTKGEEQANQHLKDAEQKAEAEKQKADDQATKKKQSAKKDSGGFFGWAKSAAKSLIDGLKSAVNAIYDGLRSVVKGIFEAAKKLAVAAIDLARTVVVGLIKGFSEILKGLVNVVFAAFPEIANRINAKIDQAVKKAEAAVNAAADLLKKGITAILDFLANTLDSILGLIQDLYNGIFTVLGMLINGELKELLGKFGNLIDAAKTVPDQFETAALEELLGGNLDESLSPAELSQAAAAGIVIPGRDQGTTEGGQTTNSSDFLRPPWTQENVGVDAVDNNMELSPELAAELMQRTNGDGEVMLGESNDQSRSMDSILSEAGISADKENVQQEADNQQAAKTLPDGLTPKQRADIKWELMKGGISKWWSDNWPLVIGGATAAFAAGTAAVIVSGGSVLGLIPPIMSVLGPLFAGLTVIQLAGHARDYVSKSWNGEIQAGGKSLSKGLAAGAIELISWLTFKAGGAALKGAKAAAKGAKAAAKGGINLVRKATQAVIKGAKYAIHKGKVLFKGIANSGIGKQVKSLKDLGKGLLGKMRLKSFRIRVANRRFILEGLINPWVLLANGTIVHKHLNELQDESLRRVRKQGSLIGKKVKVDGKDGIIVGIKDTSPNPASAGSRIIDPSKSVKQLLGRRPGKNRFIYHDELKNMSPEEIKKILKSTDFSDSSLRPKNASVDSTGLTYHGQSTTLTSAANYGSISFLENALSSNGGILKVSDLMKLTPHGTPNSWGIAKRIAHGFKFGFQIPDPSHTTGFRNVQVKFHAPDPLAPVGSNAASGWTAQVKIGNRFLKAGGGTANAANLNDVHIPIRW